MPPRLHRPAPRTYARILQCIILAAFLLDCNPLSAQKEGIAMVSEAAYPYKNDIEKGRYDKVEAKLERRLSRDTDNLECHYAAYRLYSVPDYSGYNLEKAYSHLVRVRTIFASAEQKQLDRWARDSYSGALFDYDLRRISTMAVAEAHRTHTVDAYRHFLDYYTLAPPDLRESVIDSRDTLEFVQTRDIGTFDMLQDFIQRRPQSKVLPDAVHLRDSLAFANADRKHTSLAYQEFIQTYPLSYLAPRANDSVYTIEYRLALHYDAEQYYRGYGERYPESPFTPLCTHLADSIEYYRDVDTTDWHSFILYLDAHNQNTAWTAHARQSLARYALSRRHLSAAHQAIHHLPVTDTLRQPLAHMLHQAYMHTSIRNYHAFYSRYPDLMPPQQRRRDSLAFQLYQNYDYRIADSCIRALAPAHEAYQMLQQILKDDLDHHRWNSAVTTALLYADDFADSYDYHRLLATLQAPSQGSPKATPIGPAVNSTKGNEYAPVISADGNTLYFAAKDRPDNIGGEDVFISHRKGNKWSPAAIEMDLSHTYGNEAPVSITTDGTTLLLFQNGLLYRADRTANGWKTQRLPDLINSSTWQADASIAANGRLLLWAAAGRTDREADSSVNIYASLLDSNGHWGEPFELGPTINTPFDERSPFLHPDMHTLYFCSEGHGSLGQMDLFMSTRLSDSSWTLWSQPVNIGKEFNTTDDDWGYKITTDGTHAYYSSVIPTRTSDASHSQDIYLATMPKTMRPQPVTVVTGTVLDRANRPVSTQICWEDPATGQLLGHANTDPANGRYYIVLPQGKRYNLYINDSLYFPTTHRVDLSLTNSAEAKPTNTASSNAHTHNFQLTTYVQMTHDGITQTLNSVQFNAANWQFTPESVAELRRLARIVKSLHLNIEITCHVDGNPDDRDNTTLSQRRADQIREYLIDLGCRPTSVTAQGLGSTQPAARRGSLHQTNRRTEVRLTQ